MTITFAMDDNLPKILIKVFLITNSNSQTLPSLPPRETTWAPKTMSSLHSPMLIAFLGGKVQKQEKPKLRD